jgi:TRAP transporter 4TM/12TM fusion protein
VILPVRPLAIATSLVAVAMSLYHVYTTALGQPETLIFRATHLAFAIVLVFLLFPGKAGDGESMGERGRRIGPLDVVLAAVSLASIAYLFVFYDYVVNRIPYIDDPTTLDIVMGLLCIGLVIEATRRVIGWALPITAMVFLAYGLFFVQVEPLRLLDQLYLTTEGIFGTTLGVSAAYVIVFVLFGSFMERSGTGQLFMDFALSLTGHTVGGPGKVSVVSSSLFGTISGSAVANVMVDGPITIPLMKRTGFRASFAAAVEATASTGGQIMPPIMGAAAFVMAEFLAVSYFQVTVWAAIPAILYYVAVFYAVHFEAKRTGLLGVPKSELPRLGAVMAERGHLFVPILIILGGMMAGYSAPLCALVGAFFCLPMALLRAGTRKGIRLRAVWDALEDGARNALSVALACACAGIVIGTIALTGLGVTFTAAVIALAQNSLVLALLLTMVAGIILGMGMPTTPAYIVMVSLLVPAVIKLGVIAPAAHMFAFYFAIVSAITPPVALAVYAAAGLAKADLWESGWAAMRVGAPAFIVPFMFVYEPAIMMIGTWPDIAIAAVTATVGCIFLASGLQAYLLAPLKRWQQAAMVVAALLLIDPGLVTDIIGFVIGGGVLLQQYLERRRAHG